MVSLSDEILKQRGNGFKELEEENAALRYELKQADALREIRDGQLEELKEGKMDKNEEIKRITNDLDRVFHRNMMADDSDETPLYREVSALENTVRDILELLKNG